MTVRSFKTSRDAPAPNFPGACAKPPNFPGAPAPNFQGAPAPNYNRGARIDEFHDAARELLRADVEDCPTAIETRHPGIRLHGDGASHQLRKAPHVWQHTVWPETAVEAEHIHAQSLKQGGDDLDACAGEERSVLTKGYGR